MNSAARIVALLSAFALAGVPVASTAFQDPLDLPATQSPLASRGLLNGIALAGKRLVTVGERGHILYSDDSGKNWTQAATVPVSSDLTAVTFASPNKGWAVGHDGVILATSDGGKNWSKQLDGRILGKLVKDYYTAHPPSDLPGGPEVQSRFQAEIDRFAEEAIEKSFLDVWFENESTGYAVGIFNLILQTTDGGKTWVPIFDRTENPNQLHFYGIHAFGDDVFLAGEQGMVLRLDRKSQRFLAVSADYKGTFFGITDNGSSLFVFGLRGTVFRSDDRGEHWQKVETGVTMSITAAARIADGRLVLVGQSGQILLSGDAGKTFTLDRAIRVPVSAVLSPSPGTLLIVGARGVHVETITK